VKKVIIILCILPLNSQIFAQDYWQMVHPPTVGPGSFNVSSKGNVFVIGGNGLKRSTNNGQTWDSLAFAYPGTSGFGTSPKGIIYLFSDSLRKSTDEGNSWATVSQPYDPYEYMRFILSNSDGDIFIQNDRYYLSETFRSSDEGNTWVEIGFDSSSFIDMTFKDNLAFATMTHYDAPHLVYRSYDNGNNWVRLTNAPSDLFTLLATKNGDIYGGRMYRLGNPPQSLFKSTDDGVTWQVDSTFTTSVTDLVENQFGHIFAATGRDVYVSTDDGNTWEQIDSGTMPPDGYQIGVDSSGYVYVIASLIQTLYRSVYSTIPVELELFSAEVIDNGIQLNWQTASELNNLGFEIERASSSTTPFSNEWILIGFVQGNGTTTETQFYSFIDENISRGNYFYRLKQYDYDGTFEYSNIVEVDVIKPNTFSLGQNYPNPFNPTTNIEFRISEFGFVSLKVYDVLGNEVATLVNEEKSAGTYDVEFDARDLTSGMYFYQLQAGTFIKTRKMVLIK
jgi:photosystem II stability/assembly factor-like uncharacterized protein